MHTKDGGLRMVNGEFRFEDWRYIDSTGSGKGELRIYCK